MTSPSDHKLSNSQLPIISLFKFVRSRRDPKEKIAGTGPDTTHLPNLANHIPNLDTHLPNLATHLPNLANLFPNLANHLPNLATHHSFVRARMRGAVKFGRWVVK
jgi:hypothetical protein